MILVRISSSESLALLNFGVVPHHHHHHEDTESYDGAGAFPGLQKPRLLLPYTQIP
jgi:hypothetical protein